MTAILWGLLPIALNIALSGIDPYTLTWYRFTVAALVLGFFLTIARKLPPIAALKAWPLLLTAVLGLSGNYILFLFALTFTSPTVAQLLTQFSSIFLLLGGLFLFKETFSRQQWAGLTLLIAGLLLFFNRRLPELSHLSSGLGFGVIVGVLASLIWAAYGLAQKRLLQQLGSQQILLLLYLGATIVLLPIARLSAIRGLSTLQLGMLIFCCFNTLMAYGAFAEALKHWQVSRVSAVIATTPLFTLVSMWFAERLIPHLVTPERLNRASVAGALLVVCGSAICALARDGEGE
jgi:drug/metabolite transporter (DMT)-like permease